MPQLPIATRITELCKAALRAHDEGDASGAKLQLEAARAELNNLTDAHTLDHARQLVDEVHGKLRKPKGLQQLN